MGHHFQNFRLLLWKNALLKWRNKTTTILEFLIPIFIVTILILLRYTFESTKYADNTIYSPYEINKLPKSLYDIPLKEGKSPWFVAYDRNDSDVINQVMKNVAEKLKVRVNGFKEEKDFINSVVLVQSKNIEYLGIVTFNDSVSSDGPFSQNITFKIRLSSSPRNLANSRASSFAGAAILKWFTKRQYPLFQIPEPRSKKSEWGGPPGYMAEGFLSLQYAVSSAIISHLSNSTEVPDIQMQRYPYPPYTDDKFIFALQYFMSVLVLFSFMFTSLNIIKNLVYETEKRLKESMKVMGLSNWLHWVAWFTKDFLFSLSSMIVFVIILNSVLQYSNGFALLIFFVAYLVNFIMFSFMVSVFFSKANSAATVSGLLFFLTYLPFLVVQQRLGTISWGTKILLCLFGNSAMSFGSSIIVMWEGVGSGLQLDNINLPASPDDDLTLFHVILMLLLDSIIYGIVTWYVEAVRPGEFGMPQPFYFPFLPEYWCGRSHNSSTTIYNSDVMNEGSKYIEKNPSGLIPGISIKGLTKKYKSTLTAVDNLYLDMFENQITALLGHNGAGKTTTMAMLTGIYPPTGGTAIINERDVRHDIAEIRQNVGFCPQHDVLFDHLTAEEHLYFFCKLKGWKGDLIDVEINRMLNAMNLNDKRKALSTTLSGGMKRKLSVGIALCAGSKVVMLDEPTSGMDPSARRATWDLLINEKKNRTILLTTHYMEEADVLGDRIAIMAGGKLQCCGSSMFLKKKYGAGYHMVLVQDSSCDVSRVTEVVNKHVPDAELESNMGAELSYILPNEASKHFEKLFQEIEDDKDKLGITGYGASITTMEEVFIKVGESFENGDSSDETLPLSKSNCSIKSYDTEICDMINDDGFNESQRNTGIKLILQQIRGLVVKRCLYSFRNKLLTLFQLAIPIIMIVIALVIIKYNPEISDSPPLTLNLEPFKKSNVPVSIYNTSDSTLMDIFKSYRMQFFDSNNKIKNISVGSVEQYNDQLVKFGKKNLMEFNLHWIIGATFTLNNESTGVITAFFNNQPYHGPPVSLWAVQNALLHYYVNSSYNFTVVNEPLPRSVDVQAIQETSQGQDGYQLAQEMMFGIAFLTASLAVFLVKERAVGAKHLQVVSGVNLITFWFTTFVWDFINYIVPSIICVLMFIAFDTDGFKEPKVQGVLIALLIIHGFAILPLIYSFSFVFKIPSKAYSRLSLLMIIFGISSLLTVTILEIPKLAEKNLAEKLDIVFSFLPMYSLGRSISQIERNYKLMSFCDTLFDMSEKTIFKKLGLNITDHSKLCEIGHMISPNTSTYCCPEYCHNEDTCFKFFKNYAAYQSPGIGRYLMFLSIDFVIFVVILILIEKKVTRSLKYYFCRARTINPKQKKLDDDENDAVIPLDDDVARESKRINTSSLSDLISTETLIFRELSKNYGSLVAVDNISLGITKGECFGLLGMNGAGKTSTFKLITGDEIISEGDAYLDGYSVKYELAKVQQRLGYCPQFDALIDELTGEETLRLFARLRGVPEHAIDNIIRSLSSELLIEKHIKKLTKEYSGGNKRKLSTAMALIGNPPAVFLDEPTAGVDPVARRMMWKTITRVKNSGRSILLTSHCMEECEALCGRLVIMVNGKFCCLGSPQHLKSKFGNGYTVLVKIRSDDLEDERRERRASSEKRSSSVMYLRQQSQMSSTSIDRIQSFRKFFANVFPTADLISSHQSFINYHIPIGENVGWAKIFGTMESAKEEYEIEDYTVSQTSLEQIFLQFAKLQRPSDD